MGQRFGVRKSEAVTSTPAPAEAFSKDKALNNGPFQQYLIKHPEGAIDMGDDAELERKFEAFQSIKKLADSLYKVGQEHFREAGINLDSKRREGILADLLEKSIDNQAEFEEIRDSVERQQGASQRIKDLEVGMAYLSGVNMPEVEAKFKKMQDELSLHLQTVGLVSSATNYLRASSGFFHWVPGKVKKEGKAAIEKLKNDGADVSLPALDKMLTDLQAELPGLKAKIKEFYTRLKMVKEDVGKVGEMKTYKEELDKQLDGLKAELLVVVGANRAVAEEVKAKAEAEVKKLLSGGNTVKDLEKAYKRLNELDDFYEDDSGERTPTGIDPLESLRVDRDELDQRMQDLATVEIGNAIQGLKGPAQGAVTKLETSLKEFIGRERMGSKDKAETAKFVVEVLGKIIEGLDLSTEDGKFKGMMAELMVIKVKDKAK